MSEPTPTGFALTPFDPVFQRDPYPVLHKVRAAAPAQWDEMMGTGGSSPRTTRFERSCATRSSVGSAQGRSHWRSPAFSCRRRSGAVDVVSRRPAPPSPAQPLVNKAFTPKAVEMMRPRIAAIANELLGAIEGNESDLMDRVAAPLPVIVIAEMLGIDTRQQYDFKAWSNAVVPASSTSCAAPKKPKSPPTRKRRSMRASARRSPNAAPCLRRI